MDESNTANLLRPLVGCGCSFVTQSRQRIDLHRATCREEGGERANDEDSQEHRGVIGHVGRLDAIEEMSEQRSNRKTQEKTGEEAEKDPGEPVGEDHAQNLSTWRANGHAD